GSGSGSEGSGSQGSGSGSAAPAETPNTIVSGASSIKISAAALAVLAVFAL
ncbi:hypothetical protein FZEAL_3141, partial [Fusarium zealandicum]